MFQLFFGTVAESKGVLLVHISSAPVTVARRDREPEKSYILERSERISFVVIDAGHGGKDPGAIGAGKLKEKHIVLKIARSLERELRHKLRNIRIYMTRRSDRFIELSKRTDIANRYLRKGKNGIFISIHANASISKRISGFEMRNTTTFF